MSANVADYELFKPLELAPGLTLQNRMVFSPCTRARSDIKTRCPTDENVKYYAARASAGLIMSEGCAVSEQGYGWRGAPALYTDEQQEDWRKIVDAVHAKGGKMFVQLWHMGHQSHPSFHPSNEVASCSASCYSTGRTHDAEGNATGFPTTRAMTLEEVKQVVEDHRKCAERAKAAGFDSVEFHGAGGYLIDEFLQTSTNKRTDEYGGSVENRFRLLRELIEAVTTVYPANRVGVRLSPNGVYGGMDSEDNYETFTYVISELSTMGLCYLATLSAFRLWPFGQVPRIHGVRAQDAVQGPRHGHLQLHARPGGGRAARRCGRPGGLRPPVPGEPGPAGTLPQRLDTDRAAAVRALLERVEGSGGLSLPSVRPEAGAGRQKHSSEPCQPLRSACDEEREDSNHYQVVPTSIGDLVLM